MPLSGLQIYHLDVLRFEVFSRSSILAKPFCKLSKQVTISAFGCSNLLECPYTTGATYLGKGNDYAEIKIEITLQE
ncbi:hypothetical protein CEXT_590401 [Caerostris extrusa]|uniref:Uncharacterized protein n=1 Tax=Caerostris extrusa TaxID=172846 RepID=A0AAV4UU92_CAEEX|nr:hypothetical protein CEXT_590401 [Caerostris extrusa]